MSKRAAVVSGLVLAVAALLLVWRPGPVSLFGRVLEAGSDEPLPGAVITVYDYERARTLNTRSDATGAFHVPEARNARGAFHLVVAPGFAPRFENGGDRLDRHKGFEVRDGAGTRVEIRLPDTVAYRVLVVDQQTGDRLAGVRFHDTLTIDRRATLVPLPAAAKGHGLYELRTALSKWKRLGSTQLVVSKEGYASAEHYFSGQDPGHLFRVVLGRGGSVRGHVWDGGEPVAGAVLLFERDVDGAILAAATSEGDGFFEVRNLVADEDLVCHCYANGLRRKLATMGFRLEDGETRTLEIGAADRTAIQGRVRLRGEPAPDVLIAVYREGGGAGQDLVEYADREGWFRFENLAPGRYEVFLNLESACLIRFVDLAEGQCLELDVDASRVVKGVLLDAETGRPITGQPELEIRATRQGSEDYAEASPDKDGRFELWIAAPGAYELDCPDEQDSYVRERPRIDLTRAQEATGLRLLLVRDKQDGSITIDVVDSKTGKPIPEGWSRFRHKTMRGNGSWEGGKEEFQRCAVGRYRILIGTDEHVPELLEIEITPERKEIERRVALEPADAVRVVRLLRGSAAGRAGVQAGDLIVTCAGTRIRNLAGLYAALEEVKGPFAIEYRREGKTVTAMLPGRPLDVEVQNFRAGE